MIPSGRERERGSGEETRKMDREADWWKSESEGEKRGGGEECM